MDLSSDANPPLIHIIKVKFTRYHDDYLIFSPTGQDQKEGKGIGGLEG